ncbi:putative hydroxymethylpyrimidine transporter CytX [Streptosporangium becharense]|uniref:Putative hydroxymethylpyrimidine transporter CytX n=1 Tax=Streptosporangium becharense TaxID=1816182 RepID=A0A7W9IG90_9ACTN|nr:cytosine permease [Streptosporangium becharense]MBB2908793.1 putative hydroxymethylpyrimidine transporter CytX [Streptosporangium becharense]MBB5820189.1 putative hydroxymethylpyrimidine transporter CytX [Streptosporangium becharense]
MKSAAVGPRSGPSETVDPKAAEAPLTLDEAPPKALGVLDQGALWANLGVSLLGFSGAITLINPLGDRPLSFAAAILAAVAGSLIGTAMVGLAAIPGQRTGAPAMVLLRGLFGARLSYLPTVLNIIQMIGWGIFELWVIARGAQAIAGSLGATGVPYAVWVVVAGVITTALTIRPLGAVRILRRYVTVGVIISMAWFLVALFRQVPTVSGGSWEAFAPSVDYVIALSVSWVPVAADFARFSRSGRAAFTGVVGGYTIAQVACLTLGIAALALVGNDPGKVWDPFVAAALGPLFFGILVLRETDQSFVNVYSTAMSLQNLLPRLDRRVISVAVGALVTLIAIFATSDAYTAFLGLIGAVFVPMFAVLAVDYFVLGGSRRWDTSDDAPARPLMMVPWALGFVAWWMLAALPVAPELRWWTSFWTGARDAIGFVPQPWMSSAVGAFLVAGLVTLALGALRRRR